MDPLDEFEQCWSGLGLDSVSICLCLGLVLVSTYNCLGLDLVSDYVALTRTLITSVNRYNMEYCL